MAKSSVDGTSVVGVTRLSEILGCHKDTARKRLEEWLVEQENGGPIRVSVQPGHRKLLFTTIGIVQREFPGIRDTGLVRKIAEQDKYIDTLYRRVDELTTRVNHLQKIVESNPPRHVKSI